MSILGEIHSIEALIAYLWPAAKPAGEKCWHIGGLGPEPGTSAKVWASGQFYDHNGGLQLDLEVWPESHWLGFALRQPDVLQSYTAW